MKLITGMLFLISSVYANLHQAPPNLNLGRAKAVFVDFKTVKSKIVYDLNSRRAKAVSEIEFSQADSGYPIYDLVPSETKVSLNGKDVSVETTSMDGVSTVKYVKQALSAGTHKLVIENDFNKNISWSTGYMKSAFWMSDLSDRRYLEQYLPTNLEFDQYQKFLEIEIKGSDSEHVLYTNGDVEELAKNSWKVEYPAVYTASSFFMHITKKGLIPEEKTTYRSIDNREIPVTVYTTQSTSRFMKATLSILAELERDYGPWPHNQVIVYGAGMGGMEHCGATITSFSALGHELIHSYFARGVMPAHGNAGWVDEAVASWRDANYMKYSQRSLYRTRMASHSIYKRTTDRDAYSRGMKFIGNFDKKFEGKKKKKKFLRSFFEERKFKPFKTEEFIVAIEKYFNEDVSALFDKYVYGKNGVDKLEKHEKVENPFHPKLSEQQLFDLL